ncbi:hypothetical protein ROE7235_02088 [Roseibaca ekhonensis]|uniref:Uncharacterized protein n=1 Tax=Roseinatronobacter ekhonensis TaxID=254356 RepID=A0A3B0M8W2_9RHOB|nr:hypothetical protein [Roseibaca ekhonensis]SUZ32332.1 hypothetical protein ROE7235_02088 [Roseibaca ekhonensis]
MNDVVERSERKIVDLARDLIFEQGQNACTVGMIGFGIAFGAGSTAGIGAPAGGMIGAVAGLTVCPVLEKGAKKLLKWNDQRQNEGAEKPGPSKHTPKGKQKTGPDLAGSVMPHEKRFLPKAEADKLFGQIRDLSDRELSDKEVRRLAAMHRQGSLPLQSKAVNAVAKRMKTSMHA